MYNLTRENPRLPNLIGASPVKLEIPIDIALKIPRIVLHEQGVTEIRMLLRIDSRQRPRLHPLVIAAVGQKTKKSMIGGQQFQPLDHRTNLPDSILMLRQLIELINHKHRRQPGLAQPRDHQRQIPVQRLQRPVWQKLITRRPFALSLRLKREVQRHRAAHRHRHARRRMRQNIRAWKHRRRHPARRKPVNLVQKILEPVAGFHLHTRRPAHTHAARLLLLQRACANLKRLRRRRQRHNFRRTLTHPTRLANALGPQNPPRAQQRPPPVAPQLHRLHPHIKRKLQPPRPPHQPASHPPRRRARLLHERFRVLRRQRPVQRHHDLRQNLGVAMPGAMRHLAAPPQQARPVDLHE